MLKISPLFSGSRGNCTLIQSNNVNILLDAGFNYRSIVAALNSHGLTPKDIDAIVISHEHSDHVNALSQWTRRTPTPIYAPQLLVDYLQQMVYCSQVQGVVDSFNIGDVNVDIYECNHDARCCYGYRFSSGKQAFACVTDTGCVTDELVSFFTPCGAIMLESNHDVDMLKKGEYRYSLKRRILSDSGHLSNEQAADVIGRLLGGNMVGNTLKNIILSHLSEKNNTHELAFNSAVTACAAHGLTEGKDVTVYVADQYNNEITICLD